MLIHGMRLLSLLGKQLVDSRFGLPFDLMITQKWPCVQSFKLRMFSIYHLRAKRIGTYKCIPTFLPFYTG